MARRGIPRQDCTATARRAHRTTYSPTRRCPSASANHGYPHASRLDRLSNRRADCHPPRRSSLPAPGRRAEPGPKAPAIAKLAGDAIVNDGLAMIKNARSSSRPSSVASRSTARDGRRWRGLRRWPAARNGTAFRSEPWRHRRGRSAPERRRGSTWLPRRSRWPNSSSMFQLGIHRDDGMRVERGPVVQQATGRLHVQPAARLICFELGFAGAIAIAQHRLVLA